MKTLMNYIIPVFMVFVFFLLLDGCKINAEHRAFNEIITVTCYENDDEKSRYTIEHECKVVTEAVSKAKQTIHNRSGYSSLE